ncbi:MAG: hypothetical protein IPP94_15360 [Ignavibacteria bacterium]|nr:hypothetical protein [Ignavibacteria bacterium]
MRMLLASASARRLTALLLFAFSVPGTSGHAQGFVPLAGGTGNGPATLDKTIHGAPSAFKTLAQGPGAWFIIENRGQLADMRGATRPDVRYVLYAGSMRIFLRATGLSFVQTVRGGRDARAHRDAGHGGEAAFAASDSIERVDVEFAGANPEPGTRGDSPLGWHVNVYSGGNAATKLPALQRIVYENVWPGVDFELRLDGRLVKYEFRVRPGGRVQDIRLRYSGNALPAVGADGRLAVRTAIGSIEEDVPVCYSIGEDGGARTAIDGRFMAVGNTVQFDVRGGVPGSTLVIDPTLSWSTYVGSAGSDYGGQVDVDGNDDVWMCGSTTGTNFPTTTGVFQTSHSAASMDAFIIKFSNAGALIWATYFAGANVATGITCDGSGNGYFTGGTGSSLFPATFGAFQTSLSSGYDAFIVKLQSDGTRGWATFYGGDDDDVGMGLTLGPGPALYVTGETKSSNFPVSSGAFQTTYGGSGSSDAFLLKFDLSGARSWSTFIGGSSDQWGHGCVVDSAGNILVVGTTETGFPTTSGTVQSTYPAGSSSGFLIKFDNSGARLWGTYFGSSTLGYDVDVIGNDPVIVGWTVGSVPVTTGAFQITRPGLEDGFVARLSSSGSSVAWATYCGGSQLDHVTGVKVGSTGTIHLIGCTYSTNFPVTPGAYQTIFGGSEDRFVARMTPTGQVCWASFLGGSGMDQCWSTPSVGERPEHAITLASGGEFYVIGSTTGSFPTTTGAFRTSSAGGDECFLMRFLNDCGGAVVAEAGNDTSICRGSAASIGQPATGSPCGTPYTYSWSPATGLNSATIAQPSAAPTVTTKYTVTVTDVNNCSSEDTVTVTVTSLGATITPSNSTLCPGRNVVLSATTGTNYSYSWLRNGIAIFGASGDTYAATQSGNYRVIISTPLGCFDTSGVAVVTQGSGPGATITAAGPTSFCTGGNVMLSANTGTGYTYVWLRNSTVVGSTGSTFLASAQGSYRVIVTNSSGCSDTSAVLVITILPGPGAAINPGGPTTFCDGESVLLSANTGSGLTYQWLRDGSPLGSATGTTFLATQRGTYRVVVTASNGCRDSSSTVDVTVHPRPVASIAASGPTTICTGQSLILSADTGTGFTYIWLRNGIIVGGMIDRTLLVTTSGNYRVIVTNGFGCPDTSSVLVITVNPRPAAGISAGGPTTFCAPGSVTFTGTPATGVTYAWLQDSALVPGATSQTFNATVSGKYQVIVTNASGCADTSALIAVTVYPRAGAFITGGPPVICEGSAAVLRSNLGIGSTAIWQRDARTIIGATDTVYTAIEAGGYRVIITTARGCVDTSATFVVNAFPKPSVSLSAAGPVLFCEPGRVTLNASTGPGATFAWYRNGTVIAGAGASAYDATASGSYRVIVTDLNGCTDTSDALAVTVNPRGGAIITPPGPLAFCEGTTTILSTANGAGFTYEWQRDGTTISSARTATYTAGQPGNYRVIITTGAGCVDTSSAVSVTVNPRPDQRIEGKTSVCPNALASYFITNSAGCRFNWTVLNGSIINGQSSPNIDVRWGAAGAGEVRVTITQALTGCTRDTLLPVSVTTALRPVIVSDGTGILCSGDSLRLDAGAGYATYEWLRDGAPLGVQTRTLLVVSPGVYEVSVTEPGGCSGISSPYAVTVQPRPVLILDANGAAVLCAGESLLLTARSTPDAVFTWLRDGAEILGATGPTYLVTQPGSYRVSGVTVAGCTALSDPLVIVVKAAPDAGATALGATTLCAGDSVALTAKPETGVTYAWLLDGAPIPGATSMRHVAMLSGRYAVIVTDAVACCKDTSAAVAVTVRPVPVARIDGNTTICGGERHARRRGHGGHAALVDGRDVADDHGDEGGACGTDGDRQRGLHGDERRHGDGEAVAVAVDPGVAEHLPGWADGAGRACGLRRIPVVDGRDDAADHGGRGRRVLGDGEGHGRLRGERHGDGDRERPAESDDIGQAGLLSGREHGAGGGFKRQLHPVYLDAGIRHDGVSQRTAALHDKCAGTVPRACCRPRRLFRQPGRGSDGGREHARHSRLAGNLRGSVRYARRGFRIHELPVEQRGVDAAHRRHGPRDVHGGCGGQRRLFLDGIRARRRAHRHAGDRGDEDVLHGRDGASDGRVAGRGVVPVVDGRADARHQRADGGRDLGAGDRQHGLRGHGDGHAAGEHDARAEHRRGAGVLRGPEHDAGRGSGSGVVPLVGSRHDDGAVGEPPARSPGGGAVYRAHRRFERMSGNRHSHGRGVSARERAHHG